MQRIEKKSRFSLLLKKRRLEEKRLLLQKICFFLIIPFFDEGLYPSLLSFLSFDEGLYPSFLSFKRTNPLKRYEDKSLKRYTLLKDKKEGYKPS